MVPSPNATGIETFDGAICGGTWLERSNSTAASSNQPSEASTDPGANIINVRKEITEKFIDRLLTVAGSAKLNRNVRDAGVGSRGIVSAKIQENSG